MYLDSLVMSLLRRYERTGAMADVNEAIEMARRSLAQTPEGHPGHAEHLSLLSYALSCRYRRTGTAADIDAAIDVGRQAIAAIPPSPEGGANVANNLGVALMDRYERTGAAKDPDEAVGRFGHAVALIPATHPNHALYLSNLAGAWLRMYELSNSASDLDEATYAAVEAAKATPPDHPDLARRLYTLGLILIRQSQRTSSRWYLDMAISDFRRAAELNTAPAHIRAEAARHWGAAAAVDSEDWTAAVEGFTAAVTLLGRLASRDLSRADQEFWLSAFTGIGCEAAACCMLAGRPEHAVELWEQGRGVLLGQALALRTDVTRLAEQQPRLAADFTELRDELDAAGQTGMGQTMPPGVGGTEAGGGNSATQEHTIERRRELADNFDNLIERIRALPGFGRFLLPPTYAEMTRLASGGPLVLINVNYARSDALLVTPGELDVINLPELTPETVQDQVTSLFTIFGSAHDPGGGLSDRAQAEGKLTRILEWLWDAIAGPVLARLGITGGPGEAGIWPRVWWCPSGPLAFLPLHAAGYHDSRFDALPRTVLDRAISSYTPTLRALSYARRPSGGGSMSPEERRVLVVAMPHTSGERDLPSAADEIGVIEARLPGQVTVLSESAAKHDSVRSALPLHQWAHFACHATSDPSDPSSNRLLLHDYQARPFRVVDVARLRLDAELAFLSACATARTGTMLADEAIQLASGFQLAGYRHVIGTLWQIGDQAAVRIAADIYTRLATEGAGSSAQALHSTIRKRRNLAAGRPSDWAAYIHTGA